MSVVMEGWLKEMVFYISNNVESGKSNKKEDTSPKSVVWNMSECLRKN